MESEKKPLQSKEKKNNKDDKNIEEVAEEKEPELGCCDQYAQCIIFTVSGIYRGIKFVCVSIRTCIAFFWLPIKERCCLCMDRCDKKLNPYKDPNYTDV